MCAAGSGVELAAAAGCLTRGRAHRTSQAPRPKHNNENSFVNVAEEVELKLACHATAVAGERGVCAPRTAASAGSHEPLPRRSPQESTSLAHCFKIMM